MKEVEITENGVAGISGIKTCFGEYKESHWRLTSQIISLESKLAEKKAERKELEKEMKTMAAEDDVLWQQIEFAF